MNELTFPQLAKLVERYTYKPDVHIRAVVGSHGPNLLIEARVFDSNGSGKLVSVGLLDVMPPTCTADMLSYIVKDGVRRLENHEMDEWLKFDGVRITNPHPLMP